MILLLAIGLSTRSACSDEDYFSLTCGAETQDGQYRYLEQIGQGSFSIVLQAQSSATGELVAIKVYNKKDGHESLDDYMERILSEFRLASQLSHPNIIRSLDLWQEGHLRWLYAMEYCPTPLITWLLTQKISHDTIADVFVQVLRAVQYLHLRDIAHRDIKIHNIVLCSGGLAKLIDFGEAMVINNRTADKVAGQ